MAAEERIVLRLDCSIPFERDLAAAYRLKSRARRQEWIRSVLRAGLDALGGRPVAVAADLRPAGPAAAGDASSATDASNTHPQPSAQGGAGRADAPPPVDASPIKGFFGDK